MVAADVCEEVFNERIIHKRWRQPPWNYWNYWKDTGLKMCNMLKDGGKVHILNYRKDIALQGSQIFQHWRARLGRYGFGPQNSRGRIHKDCIGKIVGFDLSTKYKEAVEREDPNLGHCYQSMAEVVDYYATAMNDKQGLSGY